MKVSRIPCLVFTVLAVFVPFMLPAIGNAQEQPAPPTRWCLRWTDNCSICERLRDNGEVKCREKPRRPSTRPQACVPGTIRCLVADIAPLNTACEKSQIIREPCNVCTSPLPDRPRMCTLKLCAVKEVVCVKPRL